MKKEVITIPGVQTPGATFNHVVKAGGLLFLTSQLSADLQTGQIIQVLLAACGATMDDIVKAVLYLRDVNDRYKVNEVYREYFTKGQEPAKVTVQAASPIGGIDIEIRRHGVPIDAVPDRGHDENGHE